MPLLRSVVTLHGVNPRTRSLTPCSLALLQDHLKNLITSHLRLHRSNLLNVASSSSSSSAALPAFLSAPASPTSTASTFPPLTPPATFSQSAFENLLTIAPATILPHGRISRLVSEGVMDEEGFQQLWEEAAAERRKVTGVDERWSSANKSAAADEPAEDADEDGKAKGKGRRYAALSRIFDRRGSFC